MKFLEWTNWKMETPTLYGWFHLMFLGIMIIATICLVIIGKNHNQKKVDKVVFFFGIFMLVIETYKQLLFTFVLNDGNFQWYAFPFQFCSSPMYVCLIFPFLKEKIKRAGYTYLAFYGLLAGLSVMLYPETVFISSVTISIHTMLWHGSMVVLGTYLITKEDLGNNIKEIIPGYLVLLGFSIIALILNISLYNLLFKTTGETFNMFFISPYYPSTLPVLSIIHSNAAPLGIFLSWLILFFCYLLAFFLGVIVIWGITKLIKCLFKINRKHIVLESVKQI